MIFSFSVNDTGGVIQYETGSYSIVAKVQTPQPFIGFESYAVMKWLWANTKDI